MPDVELEKRLQHARTKVGGDPWAKFVGIEIEEVDHAYAKVSLVPQAHHLNSLDIVHGAALYALADQAFAVASNTLERPNVLIESSMNFMSGGKPGVKLTAVVRARELKRKLAIWDVEITDDQGTTVALARGITYGL